MAAVAPRSARADVGVPVIDSQARSVLPKHGPGPVARWITSPAARNVLRDVIRLAAVALVPVVAGPDDAVSVPLYGFMIVFVLATSVFPRSRKVDVAETGLATVIAWVTGGIATGFVPYLVVAVAVVGFRSRMLAGAGVGALVATGQTWSLVSAGVLPSVPMLYLVPLLTFLPLVGFTAAMTRRVLFGDVTSGRAALEEANQLLQGLSTISQEIPGGLEPTMITAAALDELQADPAVDAVVIYAGTGPLLHRLAAGGFDSPPPASLPVDVLVGPAQRRSVRLVAAGSLPVPLQPNGEDLPSWLVIPVLRRDNLSCCIIIGGTDHRRLRARQPWLVDLAQDTALALDNARLFGGAQARAADAARRRIAHDLHDGVAQSLTHLRMELDLLTQRAEHPHLAEELTKLSGVTGRALTDVRATIDGLRNRIVHSGLASAITQHAVDLDGTCGVRVISDGVREVSLPDDHAVQVFRVAQEALSNAVRHSNATSVEVTLEADDEHAILIVEDDGGGIPAVPRQGVGLAAMHQRAHELQGELVLRPRHGGGTVVTLRCPIDAQA